MDAKKSYIPLKVLISYLLLASLIVSVGWFLYSENKVFAATEIKIANENKKVLKVSNLLSNMYKAESLARITIQSDSEKDFENYTLKTNSVREEIDSLKILLVNTYQIQLLDTVNYLLTQKTINIRQLKQIKNKGKEDGAVKNAINDLNKMEASLKKLQLEDFVKYPAEMDSYQRKVLKEYVAYLNTNIPDDSTNTLSKKASDSIINASRSLLKKVKEEAENRNTATNYEENKILANGLSISEKLREILNVIEREIIINTSNNNLQRENSLKNTNQIVSIAAVIGLVLTVFFSVLIINDFSKTESYKKQLERANAKATSLLKNREQLIATVSHDLKTPLSTIIGYSELLGNSELNNKQLNFIRNIKSASKYVSQLIQDLLDFTQIEAGKISVEKIPFSLKELTNEIAKSIQSVYEQKNIVLNINIDEKLNNLIIGDPFRLRQILSNLIGNAYKFTEEGFINVKAFANLETDKITIRIEDSGIGIEEQKQDLIFEEFTQADDKIVKKYGGTGLGLTISKKMVEILGGTISLESVFQKGSVFEIELPLTYDKKPTKKEIIPIITTDKKELTAIVIDDDPNLLELTSEVLRLNNYLVYPFNSAAGALLAIENISFDFVITDIQMPDVDGFDFLEKLKQHPTIYKNQAVIALTGRIDLDKSTYEDAGFSELIKKPYSPKVLIDTINLLFNPEKINVVSEPIKVDLDLSNTYSLKTLKSFLSDEKEVLIEVVLAFKLTSIENLNHLEKAYSDKDIAEIKLISHRMCPMFKQVQANEISTILDNLELTEPTLTAIKIDLDALKEKIPALFSLIEKENF